MATGWKRVYYRTSLRLKLLLVTIVAVGAVSLVSMTWTIEAQTRAHLALLEKGARSLMEGIYGGIAYPMALGDSATVETQLQDVRRRVEGVEVFITDFDRRLSYASEEARVHSSLDDHLWGDEAREALSRALKTGETPRHAILEKQGDRTALLDIKPILNEASCHHCHGATRKVLGAMVIRSDAAGALLSIASGRDRMLLVSGVQLVGIVVLLNLLLYRLVTRRTRRLAAACEEVAAGKKDAALEDPSEDSLGVLTRHFNAMVRTIGDQMEYATSLRDGIAEPFFILDSRMRITYINEAATALVGMRREDILAGMTCEEVFRSDLCGETCPVRQALTTGIPTVGRRVVMRGRDGRPVHGVICAAALKDSRGKILGAFELLRDISSEVQAEEAIRGSLAQVEEVRQGLQQGVSDLSGVLDRVSRGDLTVRAQPMGRNPELDALVEKINATLDDMQTLIAGTKRAALTVVRGVGEISRQNQELAARTEQQAATMEETSATLEELAATMNENAENTQRVNGLSQEALQVATASEEIVEKTTGAMKDMAERSRKIVQMMDLINEITFQTNLLSINAAIEAARAGEQGKGFAVVATEVRGLAQRSKEASRDIADLVREITERVAASKEWVGELKGSFERIVETIRRAAEALHEVTAATQESTRAVGQIDHAAEDMAKVVERNAGMVEDLADAAEQLNERALHLRELTEKFFLGKEDREVPQEEIFKRRPKPVAQERRGQKGPVNRPLREDLLRRPEIEEISEDVIEKELEEGFEEF